ncbi:17496_t:CDS:1, partial [Cetraspora pellucida]
MPNNPERRIINGCHTCRTPIYEGEPIYTSSKGQSSVYTKGAYAGKVFGSYGGYEVGGHAGHHSGTYASENWAQ